MRSRLLLCAALLLPILLGAAGWFAQPPTVALRLQPDSFRTFAPSPLLFQQSQIGPIPVYQPRITNVQIIDLDNDGLQDVVACDAQRQRVYFCRQQPRGQWQEIALGDELAAPAHAAVVDLDGDGDSDIVVAVLGSVSPTDDLVGKVVWLENRGNFQFQTHVILDHLHRVADVQAGDLDGDGDVDLVVAEFGYDHGRVLWLENMGKNQFRDQELWAAPGAIHVPIADYDGDGDLDVVALISQEDEEVWTFENKGGGKFEPRLLFSTPNFDLGSAGLFRGDLNKDGKPDLLLVAGDNLEVQYPQAQPWHGCLWLENRSAWRFEPKRLAHLGGTYAAAEADLDGDGDQDIVLVSMFNDWRRPGSASVVWLENDGKQNFRTWQIADRPTHLATVACGDLDGDGRPDIVAGGFHLMAPFDRIGRITAWLSRKAP
ncbi:MAG: VCBS repeat-containing protein [Gemmataceae bacterium]|nr:VCBS repeat-containing protein [Gemmataceae bacterium]